MTPSYDDACKEALAALSAGDAQTAFNHFRAVLEFPAEQLDSRERWQDALRVFAQITAALGGDRLAQGLLLAAMQPDEVRLLVGLGKRFIDEGIPAVAATLLARANQVRPADEETLSELAVALERDGNCAASCEFLRGAPEVLSRSPLCRYLLSFHALLTGDLLAPRLLLPGLADGPDPHGIVRIGAERLAGMLRRADALQDVSPLDDRDLRGWHFVLTGGLLLHLSPHGVESMNGRYAFVQDDQRICLEGIHRLQTVLDVWGVQLPRVLVLPDRDSVVLGHAAARVLGLPAEPWPEVASEQPGLIVAYDLEQVAEDLRGPLATHHPGQILWCHAVSWVPEPPFAADLTTYLYQINTSPWGPRMQFDGEQAEWTEPVEGSVEELASGVVNAALGPEALEDVGTLESLARAAATVEGADGTAALRTAGQRLRQGCGSPVASGRLF